MPRSLPTKPLRPKRAKDVPELSTRLVLVHDDKEGLHDFRRFRLRAFVQAFARRSTSVFGTETMCRVAAFMRSMASLASVLVIVSSFRAVVAGAIVQHVSGSALPVRAL
jgi:hypothetical protein